MRFYSFAKFSKWSIFPAKLMTNSLKVLTLVESSFRAKIISLRMSSLYSVTKLRFLKKFVSEIVVILMIFPKFVVYPSMAFFYSKNSQSILEKARLLVVAFSKYM